MEKATKVYTGKLSPAAVDECSAFLQEALSGFKIENRDVKRYILTVEEILLNAMETDEVPFSVQVGTRLRRPYMELVIEGEADNAYVSESSGALGDGMLKHLGLAPEYTYQNMRNVYTFRMKKKRVSPFFMLIAALIAAVLVGFGGLAIPMDIRQSFLDILLVPLHDTFLNVLGCIAGPMVFLSVAWGIYGIGDAATLKRIGKNLLLTYIGIVFLAVTAVTLLGMPLFDLNFAASTGGSGVFSDLLNMILQIFPGDIFSPFVSGNTLQIIFLAVVIGIAMLFLGRKTKAVALAVEQINYIVQFLIEIISRLVPFFVFIVLVEMIWSDSASVFVGVGKLFVVFIGACILVAAAILCFTGLNTRTSPLKLARKGMTTLLVAITTASSAAAFGTNITACRTRYGIDDKITSFGIPLGMVTFKPTTAIGYTVIALYFAESYGVSVSVPWVLTLILTVNLLALATPPIPGGAMAAYTVLLSQLGIPAEALAVILACDILIDFMETGMDQFLLPIGLLNQANRMGLVNRKILKK